MTIKKTSRLAKLTISRAHNIRCYSLNNNFLGAPLTENPVVWAPIVEGEYKHLIPVSQPEFLTRELQSRHATLSVTERLKEGHWYGTGHYCIHVHSNLWYEFEA